MKEKVFLKRLIRFAFPRCFLYPCSTAYPYLPCLAMQLTFFFLCGTFLIKLDGQRILNAEHVGLIAFAPLLKYYSSCIVKLESKRYGQ